MDSQMKKGILEMCLLFIISKEDVYGYQLLQRMSNLFPDLNDSSVYAILRRIHAQGYTQTYRSSVSNGPERKYYQITESGRLYLQGTLSGFYDIVSAAKALGIIEASS